MFVWAKRFFGMRRNLRWGKRARGRGDDEGALGEALARAHLEKRGYRILAANWRSPRDRRDEIDLVALDCETLVFIEVKARTTNALVSGRYAVDARKKRVLRRAAYAYLHGLKHLPKNVRFDVVEVGLQNSGASGGLGGDPVVRHFKALPLFPKAFRLRLGED